MAAGAPIGVASATPEPVETNTADGAATEGRAAKASSIGQGGGEELGGDRKGGGLDGRHWMGGTGWEALDGRHWMGTG